MPDYLVRRLLAHSLLMVPRSQASTRPGSSPASRPKVFSACTTLSKFSKVPVKARSRACCHTSLLFFPWMISGLIFILCASSGLFVRVSRACRSDHANCIFTAMLCAWLTLRDIPNGLWQPTISGNKNDAVHARLVTALHGG